MNPLPVLRACFAWYALAAGGVVVFCFVQFANWLGGVPLPPQAQALAGAAAGTLIALSVLLLVDERRNPRRVWMPPAGKGFSRTAKATAGFAAAAGVLDSALRLQFGHAAWIAVLATAAVGVIAAVFARFDRLARMEESNS